MKVCSCCFADREIKSYIASESTEIGKCDYCNEYCDLLDIGELLDFFKEFLNIFQPADKGFNLVDIIHTDWGIFTSPNVASDILSDATSATNQHNLLKSYVTYNDNILECVRHWDKLKNNIRKEWRFVTNTEKLQDYEWDSLFSKPEIIDTNKLLYRARIHQEENQDAYPIDEMYTPPTEKTSAGRANPLGIPYLYLSESPDTTLYETRALFLDDISIGTFKIKNEKQVKIVDLTDELSNYESPFVSEDMKILTKSKMLTRIISKDLAKPLRRYDSEIEYIHTQFICEYVRYVSGANGIKFNSSLHTDGINYVIFNPELFECIKVEKRHITSVTIDSTICCNQLTINNENKTEENFNRSNKKRYQSKK
ncbi:MAG: RES family NAD+ phosphorylase [bacterium]